MRYTNWDIYKDDCYMSKIETSLHLCMNVLGLVYWMQTIIKVKYKESVLRHINKNFCPLKRDYMKKSTIDD